jgi:hypothetical protein
MLYTREQFVQAMDAGDIDGLVWWDGTHFESSFVAEDYVKELAAEAGVSLREMQTDFLESGGLSTDEIARFFAAGFNE